MAQSKPAGPRPILVGGFVLGSVLLGAAYWHPTLHIIWQVPLGLLLTVMSLGKMVSR